MLESNFQSQTFFCDLFGEYGHHPIILFCIFYIQKTSLRQKPVPVFQFKEVLAAALSRPTHHFCNQLNTPRFTLPYS